MKNVFTRLFGLCLSLLLVFSLMPQRAHAASAGLSASASTLRAGNSFTVYLSVSGSSVAGLEASMSYDSSTLTYNGYKNSLGGSWVLSESSRIFSMYNSSGDTFSGSTRVIALSFTVKRIPRENTFSFWRAVSRKIKQTNSPPIPRST